MRGTRRVPPPPEVVGPKPRALSARREAVTSEGQNEGYTTLGMFSISGLVLGLE